MRYVLDEKQMQEIDGQTIRQVGIPSMVLMERAAVCVAEAAESMLGKGRRVLAVCGTGGNGGDAIALARILHLKGYQAELYPAWEQKETEAQDGEAKGAEVSHEPKLHPSTEQQLQIARNCGVPEAARTGKKIDFSAYDVIVDGLFGIGLTREITGVYADCIRAINASGKPVIAVDIPSGIHAGSGAVMGVAVRATHTVTFGEAKAGQLLYPGAEYCGKLLVCDIGFPAFVTERVLVQSGYRMFTYGGEDVARLPERRAYSNKGTYGKVLVIAGSKEITGAAYLCAKAAYQMGVGLVKLLSAAECVNCVRQMLPEALMAVREETPEQLREQLKRELAWADAVVAGPGISTGAKARELFEALLMEINEQKKPLLLDADALNLLAEKPEEMQSAMLPEGTVLTPHLKELSRLKKIPVEKIAATLIDTAKQCTYNNELVYVIKDARTIVAAGNEYYINTSGCDGMATGGSGDVLAGMIGGLLTAMPPAEAARLGVYLHGLAGEKAAEKKGKRAMLAGDLLEAYALLRQ
ncbi:MAG: NAD(P)H-hydrate dehydratase [Lachnospiraceae bacterium]|nr:NAD(P)H-hydrate dehydratase [Lachnospiraceae bacterium]